MDHFYILIWLLPIVFMIHDFEEIIFMKAWQEKNRDYLIAKFPFLSKRILPKSGTFSTSLFSLAVFEEFVLLSIITVTAIVFQYYYIWLAAFMAFSIHLVIHIIQWVVVRKYIPAIVTSILLLPYSIYGFIKISGSSYFTNSDIILWTIIGFALMAVNLIFAHWLADKFQKYIS